MKAKTRALLYVAMQGILLVMLIFWNNPPGPHLWMEQVLGTVLTWIGIVGVIVSAVSIRTSLTVMPIPKSGARLSQGGLYKYVRHPMYTAVLLFGAGQTLQAGAFVSFMLWIALAILLYEKSQFEERQMTKRFKDYAAYAARTPRFVPLWPRRHL